MDEDLSDKGTLLIHSLKLLRDYILALGKLENVLDSIYDS